MDEECSSDAEEELPSKSNYSFIRRMFEKPNIDNKVMDDYRDSIYESKMKMTRTYILIAAIIYLINYIMTFEYFQDSESIEHKIVNYSNWMVVITMTVNMSVSMYFNRLDVIYPTLIFMLLHNWVRLIDTEGIKIILANSHSHLWVIYNIGDVCLCQIFVNSITSIKYSIPITFFTALNAHALTFRFETVDTPLLTAIANRTGLYALNVCNIFFYITAILFLMEYCIKEIIKAWSIRDML